MTTTSFAFLRGGAFDGARRACERAGGGYPFLLQQRSVEEERTTTTTTTTFYDDDGAPEENDDAPESSFEPVDEATTTGGGDADDGTLRYTRRELLALRDAAVATPAGIDAEEMRSYPWRVREGVDTRGDAVVVQATRASSHSVEEMTDEEKAVAKAADAAARLATLWQEDETYEVDEAEAARVLAEVDARERRKESESLAVSGKFRVTFRDGAVRKFVNEAYADDEEDEEESDVKTAILYGTRKRNETARYDVDVAFIQAWDGDLAHVLSWVAKHPREANELVGPIGWLRTNAGLGPHLPEKIKLAYEALELITDASAARLFVSLDLLISAHGDVTMECYDAATGEGFEYVLGGDDLS